MKASRQLSAISFQFDGALTSFREERIGDVSIECSIEELTAES